MNGADDDVVTAEEAEATIADMVRVAAALRTGRPPEGVAIVYASGGKLVVYGDELVGLIRHAVIAARLTQPKADAAPAESSAPRVLRPRRRRPGRRR